MNIMVILYNGNSIDDKQGVMEAIARTLESCLGAEKVRFITPESSDFTTGYKETTNDRQEAVDNAAVLISEVGNIRTSSITDFSTILTINAIKGNRELMHALFIMNAVDSVTEITKEIRQKYNFTKHHLAACKSVFGLATQ